MIEEPPEQGPKLTLGHCAEMMDKPARALLQRLHIVGLDRPEKRNGVLARDIPDAVRPELPTHKLARHHEEQRALDQPAADKQLGRAQRHRRMQTRWPADVAGMNQQMVERDKALKIERARIRRCQ